MMGRSFIAEDFQGMTKNFKRGKMKNKKENKLKRLARSFYGALKSLGFALPAIVVVILLTGLFRTFISKKMIVSIFSGHGLLDTLVGSISGSISAGNPITSYIIGGELLKNSVSLFAVTSFIVAWVTVGIIQLPVESAFLGKRFAVVRNGVSFILSILVSIATVLTLRTIS